MRLNKSAMRFAMGAFESKYRGASSVAATLKLATEVNRNMGKTHARKRYTLRKKFEHERIGAELIFIMSWINVYLAYN